MSNNVIPKLIHYCWFGKKAKPKLINQCISSWKRYFKDYRIIEWNEDNYYSTHPFFIEAIEKKMWAFASDFARLDILNRYGGIYFDTDLLVINSFSHLLTHEINVGAEHKDFINGAFLASKKNQSFLVDCLSYYDQLAVKTKERDLMQMTIPRIMTKVLFSKYLDVCEFNEIIDANEIRIFPVDYFYPLPYERRMELNNYKGFLTKNSVGVHLWSSSWKRFSALYYFEHKHFLKGILTLAPEIMKGETRISKGYIKKLIKIVFEKRSI